MSLWADYKLEREGKFSIENEKCLCIYSINEQQSYCYLEDLYVTPEHRRTGVSNEIADFIFSLSKSKGLKKVITSLVPSANGSDISLKVILDYGFKLRSSHDNIIFFEKEVE